jgi:hypothetical protein
MSLAWPPSLILTSAAAVRLMYTAQRVNDIATRVEKEKEKRCFAQGGYHEGCLNLIHLLVSRPSLNRNVCIQLVDSDFVFTKKLIFLLRGGGTEYMPIINIEFESA